jgi:hypothetical protein
MYVCPRKSADAQHRAKRTSVKTNQKVVAEKLVSKKIFSFKSEWT